jgi:hypothetical protein
MEPLRWAWSSIFGMDTHHFISSSSSSSVFVCLSLRWCCFPLCFAIIEQTDLLLAMTLLLIDDFSIVGLSGVGWLIWGGIY